jgi:hypothetical protein
MILTDLFETASLPARIALLSSFPSDKGEATRRYQERLLK